MSIEEGGAHFRVVHLPGAEWSAEAGPFAVAVTGTEFDLTWKAERLDLVMQDGSVLVRGPLASDGIALRGGQHLTVDVARGELTIAEPKSAAAKSALLARRALLAERSRFKSSAEARSAAFLLGRMSEAGSPAAAISWYDQYLSEGPIQLRANRGPNRIVDRGSGRSNEQGRISRSGVRAPSGASSRSKRRCRAAVEYR